MPKYTKLCIWSFVCFLGILVGCTPKNPAPESPDLAVSSSGLQTDSALAQASGMEALDAEEIDAEELDAEFDIADLSLESDFSIFRTDMPFEMSKPADGRVSSSFGTRKHPIKKRRVFHRGVDINAKRGTPVMAAASGKVVFTGVRGRGYGKTIEIRHENGMVTRYAHLDAIQVKPGQRVTADTLIGKLGRTGRTTGPNLHFELLANGKPVNPERYWNASPWRKATALVQEKSADKKASSMH